MSLAVCCQLLDNAAREDLQGLCFFEKGEKAPQHPPTPMLLSV